MIFQYAEIFQEFEQKSSRVKKCCDDHKHYESVPRTGTYLDKSPDAQRGNFFKYL